MPQTPLGVAFLWYVQVTENSTHSYIDILYSICVPQTSKLPFLDHNSLKINWNNIDYNLYMMLRILYIISVCDNKKPGEMVVI